MGCKRYSIFVARLLAVHLHVSALSVIPGPLWIQLFQLAIMGCSGSTFSAYLPPEHPVIANRKNRIQNRHRITEKISCQSCTPCPRPLGQRQDRLTGINCQGRERVQKIKYKNAGQEQPISLLLFSLAFLSVVPRGREAILGRNYKKCLTFMLDCIVKQMTRLRMRLLQKRNCSKRDRWEGREHC